MEKGEPFALLVGMQIGVTTVENSMAFPQNDPAIPLLGLYLKKPKTLIQKNICTPMFTAALFIVAKVWKLPKCPSVDEWIKIAVVNSPCLFRKNYNSFSVNEGKLFFRKSAS